MNQSNHHIEFFSMLERVLLRCWLFGFVLLLIWVAASSAGRGFVHQLHGNIFGISEHELDLIFYCGMGFTKILVLLFFFAPWLAIKMVLSKANQPGL